MNGGGGGHAGYGGIGCLSPTTDVTPGKFFDSVIKPVLYGGSGSGGAKGGGIIWIQANNLINNGGISANGVNSGTNTGGGGAGGAIYINLQRGEITLITPITTLQYPSDIII